MALKRSLIFLLSLVVASFIGLSLFQSFSEPQVQDRLALAQTYLTLQASEYQGEGSEQLSQALLGERPYETALGQYRPLLKNAQDNLNRTTTELDALERDSTNRASSRSSSGSTADSTASQLQQLKAEQQKQQQFLQELQLEAGLLSALAQNPAQAQDYWQAAQGRIPGQAQEQAQEQVQEQMRRPGEANLLTPSETAQTAEILSALWANPPKLLPQAEPILKRNLRGWFRDEALVRLYTLEQRQADLEAVEAERQAIAQRNLTSLLPESVSKGGGTLFGCGGGVGDGIGVGGREQPPHTSVGATVSPLPDLFDSN